jgi:uncharacterized protein (DUF2267 family)
MRYATFMTTVEQAAGITPAEAERAVQATLETLADRITGGEAEDIAAFLPEELRPLLPSVPERAQRFDREGFIRRVAEREGVDFATAEQHARAVFTALGYAVAPGELRDMAAQLPADFEDLLEAAGVGRRRALAADRLVSRVAEVARLDPEQARRVTEAVLETLAVRLSDGEVDDLAAELPADLLPSLERGLAERREATAMSKEEFVARVAEREGVAREEAERHVRAVFAVLRETVSGEEFSDMAAQLSADYAPLLQAAR